MLVSLSNDHSHVSLANSEFIIGRSRGSNLHLPEPNVSGTLCTISRQGNKVAIEVNNNTGKVPVLLNGKRLDLGIKHPLKSGDELSIQPSTNRSYSYVRGRVVQRLTLIRHSCQ